MMPKRLRVTLHLQNRENYNLSRLLPFIVGLNRQKSFPKTSSDSQMDGRKFEVFEESNIIYISGEMNAKSRNLEIDKLRMSKKMKRAYLRMQDAYLKVLTFQHLMVPPSKQSGNIIEQLAEQLKKREQVRWIHNYPCHLDEATNLEDEISEQI